MKSIAFVLFPSRSEHCLKIALKTPFLFGQLPENGRDQGRFGQGHKELLWCFGSRSDTKLSLRSLAERSLGPQAKLPARRVFTAVAMVASRRPPPRPGDVTEPGQWERGQAPGPALVAGAALAAGRRAKRAGSRLLAARSAAPVSTPRPSPAARRPPPPAPAARRPPPSHDVPDAEQQLRGRPLLRVSGPAAGSGGGRAGGGAAGPRRCVCEGL